jgi:hypothetical protein
VSKPKATLILGLIVGLAAAAAGPAALAQAIEKQGEPPQQQKKKAPAEVDPKEVLQLMTGTWDVQARVFMDPSAEPVEMKGTSINIMEVAETYLQSRFKGEFMGDSLVGIGYDGYDPVREKFVGVWMDSMFPGISTYEGTWDPETRSLTAFGEELDPETGKTHRVKGVTTFRSKVMYTYQAWKETSAGEWEKSFEAIFGKVE